MTTVAIAMVVIAAIVVGGYFLWEYYLKEQMGATDVVTSSTTEVIVPVPAPVPIPVSGGGSGGSSSSTDDGPLPDPMVADEETESVPAETPEEQPVVEQIYKCSRSGQTLTNVAHSELPVCQNSHGNSYCPEGTVRRYKKEKWYCDKPNDDEKEMCPDGYTLERAWGGQKNFHLICRDVKNMKWRCPSGYTRVNANPWCSKCPQATTMQNGKCMYPGGKSWRCPPGQAMAYNGTKWDCISPKDAISKTGLDIDCKRTSTIEGVGTHIRCRNHSSAGQNQGVSCPTGMIQLEHPPYCVMPCPPGTTLERDTTTRPKTLRCMNNDYAPNQGRQQFTCPEGMKKLGWKPYCKYIWEYDLMKSCPPGTSLIETKINDKRHMFCQSKDLSDNTRVCPTGYTKVDKPPTCVKA